MYLQINTTTDEGPINSSHFAKVACNFVAKSKPGNVCSMVPPRTAEITLYKVTLRHITTMAKLHNKKLENIFKFLKFSGNKESLTHSPESVSTKDASVYVDIGNLRLCAPPKQEEEDEEETGDEEPPPEKKTKKSNKKKEEQEESVAGSKRARRHSNVGEKPASGDPPASPKPKKKK